ncbi:MAG: HlyD family secretion protein, partial [Brevundimonas sp.]
MQILSSLFRPEAVHRANVRLRGNVVLLTSFPTKLLCILIAAIVAASVVLLTTATYARKETVVGWLAPDSGLIRLTARQGGTIEDVLVQEGQTVASGAPIAHIRLSSALVGGDSFSALSKSFEAQREAAVMHARAARDTLAAEERQLEARRITLAREKVQAETRLTLQRERLSLADAEVDRAETIAAQGFLPRRELESRRSAALAIEQEAAELAGTVLSYQREIGDIDARLASIPIDLKSAQAEADTVAASLDQQRTQTESQSVYVVVATVAGKVAALPFARGQTVAPDATVAVLTPGSGRLEAELYAPSRAAGFVQDGQEVRLMYQAFPYQKFGAGEGRIESVSRTVLAPSEVAIPGLQVQEPVFRVRATLDRDTISAYGREVPLQPGMLLTADVVIDRRTLL